MGLRRFRLALHGADLFGEDEQRIENRFGRDSRERWRGGGLGGRGFRDCAFARRSFDRMKFGWRSFDCHGFDWHGFDWHGFDWHGFDWHGFDWHNLGIASGAFFDGGGNFAAALRAYPVEHAPIYP